MGSPNSETELKEIIDSIHLERGVQQESLFQKKYALPIFLAITIGFFNQLLGINAILYYSNYIFASAGFSAGLAALQTVGVGLVNLLATFVGTSLIDKLGRKTLLLIGSIGMAMALSGNLCFSRSPGFVGLAPRVHYFLRSVPRFGHLGLYRGSLSFTG